MNPKYLVTIRYENDQTDVITISANAKHNAEGKVTSNTWVRCEETERYINMSKVKWFQVSESN